MYIQLLLTQTAYISKLLWMYPSVCYPLDSAKGIRS